MAQEANYYGLLEISTEADLHEIAQAYREQSRRLQAEADELDPAEFDTRQTLLKTAFDVLSNPLRRADYDAGLALRAAEIGILQPTLAERKPRSPLRTLLTVIAALLAVGLTIQVSVMLMAYKRAQAVYGEEAGLSNAPGSAADKAALQDFYQTYGIRAKSRAEMELLREDIRRKEAAEREAQQQERQQERQQDEQARKERQFADEAHRVGEQVSADLRRAERELEMARAEAQRQAEEKERQAEENERRKKEMERERIEQSVNRWRYQSSRDPE